MLGVVFCALVTLVVECDRVRAVLFLPVVPLTFDLSDFIDADAPVAAAIA